jgi:hypothetical protein
MKANNLSPVLEMAIQLLEDEQHAMRADLVWGKPRTVEDIERHSLGHGYIGANGGVIAIARTGLAEYLAVDVAGSLVLTRPEKLPCRVRGGQKAMVGPIAFGNEGNA